jgi:multiple antibiotic resistance protein
MGGLRAPVHCAGAWAGPPIGAPQQRGSVTIDVGLQTLLTLFVVIDPVGLVPVFIALVGTRSSAAQRSTARRAILIAGGLLGVFALVGGPLLAYLGISVAALQVAGGILLFRIAVDMVFAQHRRESEDEEAEARTREDVSVFPLAIPMIAGPGALASVLVLTSQAQGEPLEIGLVLLMTALVLLMAYALMRAAARVSTLLGRTGVNVVTRVLGLILAALAVQYVADGLLGLWP